MSSTNVCWQAVSSTMRRKNGSIRFALSWLDYGKMFLSESIKALQWKLNRHSNSFLDQFQSSVSLHFLEPKFTWIQCSGSMSLSSLSKRFLRLKNRWVQILFSNIIVIIFNNLFKFSIIQENIAIHCYAKIFKPSENKFKPSVGKFIAVFQTLGQFKRTKYFIDSNYPILPTNIAARWPQQAATKTASTDEECKKCD